MRLIAAEDGAAAASVAAGMVATACIEAIASRGLALIALSGGRTPAAMLEQFRLCALDWSRVHVAQVDERVAAGDDPRRNVHRLRGTLVHNGALPEANLHAMPVGDDSIVEAANRYALQLEALGGAPLRFDLVQLGLGEDGHTASLVPGDPIVDLTDRDVAISAPYQGLVRMTLTLPALNRARARLWLVTGRPKRDALERLLLRTGAEPSARVDRTNASVVADAAAISPAVARWNPEPT